MKNIFTKNDWLLFGGVALWITKTAVFGFNDEPCCAVERILDIIAWVAILRGFFGGILDGIEIHKTKNETNKTIIKVEKGAYYLSKDAIVAMNKSSKK